MILLAYLGGFALGYQVAALNSDGTVPPWSSLIRKGLLHFNPRCPECNGAQVIQLVPRQLNRAPSWPARNPR